MIQEIPLVDMDVVETKEPAPKRARRREANLTQGRRPEWLRVRAPQGPEYDRLQDLMRGLTLHTVCEEASCPNIGECWGRGTATFLLLGDVCTRSCGFCNVQRGRPKSYDLQEPVRVAEAVAHMKLRHVVLTSVNRDELPDGGSWVFAETIRQIRMRLPECTIETLIPDFKGDPTALETVMAAHPEILNHNVETVPRLYRTVRPQARYQRSLEVIRRAKAFDAAALTKSGVMLGLGETWGELLRVMDDLRRVDCDIITIGQYLQPSRYHLPIERYYTPEEFAGLQEEGEARGFKWVESGPLVRSSYHADGQAHLSRRQDVG